MMKPVIIGIVQEKSHVGDFQANQAMIAAYYERVKDPQSAQYCDLLVFHEMTLCGYPIGDYAYHHDFYAKQDEFMQALAQLTKPKGAPAMVVGGVRHQWVKDKLKIYNSLFLLKSGQITPIHDKILRPITAYLMKSVILTRGSNAPPLIVMVLKLVC